MGCRRNYFLPNGADTLFFNPTKSNEELQEKLGTTGHTLVFYGLIEHWIDFETMLSGFQIVKKNLPDAKLLIIGSTLTNYTEKLKKMLREANLEKDVILTGYVPNDQVPYYLNLGQVCLMPYKTNTFSGKIRLPLKLFIYSAMGKSILSVSLPEAKRLGPKHVFYYHDKLSFADQALKLLTNEKLQNDLGSYAREFAKEFDYSKLARDCEAILEENLESAKSSL
jgi:phosphatidylinositol alpha-1,6-mannosyltransferase